jgi:hypothetical protein
MRLLALAAVSLALAGCGDEYYQTRYIPVSSESTYSAYEQAGWSGDREVYELPANPPAYGEMHRPRKDCLQPGQQFKPQTMAGITDEQHHDEIADVTPISATNDLSTGNPYPRPKDYPVAAWDEAKPAGAHEPTGVTQVGIDDRGPFPFRGSGTETIPANKVADWKDPEGWCIDQGQR